MSLQVSNEKYLYYYSKRPSEFVGCCALWKTMSPLKTGTELKMGTEPLSFSLAKNHF